MANIDGVENITLGVMKELFEKIGNKSIREALPMMREFRDEYGFSDKQTLKVYGIAQQLFDA